MAAREPLELQPIEPGDDPLGDQLFDILRDALQPDSRLSLESLVQHITELLPEGKPYSTEVGLSLETCYEIPYSHATMVKIVTVIELVLNSTRFPKVDETDDMQTDPRFRCQKLGEALRGWWNSNSPSEDPSKYVSFQTFAARIYERGMLQGSNLAVWALQDVLEGRKKVNGKEDEAYVVAASQWILFYGEEIYREAVAGGEPFLPLNSSTHLTLRRWRCWCEELHAIANGKRDTKNFLLGQERKAIADRATVAMEDLERKNVE